MTNMDKLYASVAANGPVCVGLDTEFSYLPADVVDDTKTAGENVVEFNRRIIEATKASAGCYKVQIAYYESLGLDGMRAYAETLKMVRATGLPVIADIKRGDIAKTAEMYAKAHFTGDFEADIITLAPYMGLDSISPYLPYCKEQGKGLFVLMPHLNPGAKILSIKSWGRPPCADLVGDPENELGRITSAQIWFIQHPVWLSAPYRGSNRHPRCLPPDLLPDPRLWRHRAAKLPILPSI